MARLFNGTTDRIDYAPPGFNPTGAPLTVMTWAWFDGLTPAATNMLWCSVDSGGVNRTMFYQLLSASGTLGFARSCATTNKTYNSQSNVITAGAWTHCAVVDDGSLNATTTKIYVNGLLTTSPAADTAGVGAEVTSNSGFSLGGRGSDDLRNLAGRMGKVSVHARMLTAGEIYSHAKGRPASDNRKGLVFDAPLNNGTWRNMRDGSGTLDGTSYIRHPAVEIVGRPTAKIFTFGALSSASPTISSTNNSNVLIDETSLIITGTGTATATTVTITDSAAQTATLTISAQDATTITCSAKDIQTTALKYGAGTVTVTNPDGSSTPFAITIAAKSGQGYVTVASYVAGENYGKGIASIADGWQVVYVTSQSGSTIAVDASTGMVVTPSLPNGTVLYRAYYNTTAHTWTEDTITLNQSAGLSGNVGISSRIGIGL